MALWCGVRSLTRIIGLALRGDKQKGLRFTAWFSFGDLDETQDSPSEQPEDRDDIHDDETDDSQDTEGEDREPANAGETAHPEEVQDARPNVLKLKTLGEV